VAKRVVAELAEELTLLLLRPPDWHPLGYLHRDPTRSAICAAFLTEDWANGGPPPTVAEVRGEMPKQSSSAAGRALDPLAASGRIEEQKAKSRIGRMLAPGQPKQWRVVDQASWQAIFDRLAQSLDGPKPPARHDATLAVILFASGLWERAGLDGPGPQVQINVGSVPEPWGPRMARARDLAAGTIVPDGETQPDVLPMIARALALGDRVVDLQ
jgi:hypothetical protein